MDDARSLGESNKIRIDHAKRANAIFEIRKHRLILKPVKFRSLYIRKEDVAAEFLVLVLVTLPREHYHFFRKFHSDIIVRGVHSQKHIAGQGPRRSGPREEIDRFYASAFDKIARHAAKFKFHRNGGIRNIFISERHFEV